MPSKLPGDKEIMRLKMLCKVMPTKSQLLTMDVMFLGGIFCFTSSTADLGNDFKTPYTERHLVLINQKST